MPSDMRPGCTCKEHTQQGEPKLKIKLFLFCSMQCSMTCESTSTPPMLDHGYSVQEDTDQEDIDCGNGTGIYVRVFDGKV